MKNATNCNTILAKKSRCSFEEVKEESSRYSKRISSEFFRVVGSNKLMSSSICCFVGPSETILNMKNLEVQENYKINNKPMRKNRRDRKKLTWISNKHCSNSIVRSSNSFTNLISSYVIQVQCIEICSNIANYSIQNFVVILRKFLTTIFAQSSPDSEQNTFTPVSWHWRKEIKESNDEVYWWLS